MKTNLQSFSSSNKHGNYSKNIYIIVLIFLSHEEKINESAFIIVCANDKDQRSFSGKWNNGEKKVASVKRVMKN